MTSSYDVSGIIRHALPMTGSIVAAESTESAAPSMSEATPLATSITFPAPLCTPVCKGSQRKRGKPTTLWNVSRVRTRSMGYEYRKSTSGCALT
jgi:hypothetical protein